MRAAKSILFVAIVGTAAPLLAQSNSVPPPAPSPIQAVKAAPPAPPLIRQIEPARALPPAVFQVEMWGGNEKLWAGQLRVGTYGGANFNSTVSDAPETCQADKSNLGFYAPNQNRSIRVSLNSRRQSETNTVFSISASWTRPGVACEEAGSSTVSFDRTFNLEVGGKTELKSDGGLVVKLSRVK